MKTLAGLALALTVAALALTPHVARAQDGADSYGTLEQEFNQSQSGYYSAFHRRTVVPEMANYRYRDRDGWGELNLLIQPTFDPNDLILVRLAQGGRVFYGRGQRGPANGWGMRGVSFFVRSSGGTRFDFNGEIGEDGGWPGTPVGEGRFSGPGGYRDRWQVYPQ